MIQDFNPVFAFKNNFRNEDANDIVASLICHPIVWELFSIEKVFLFTENQIGKDLKNWTLEKVINNIEKFTDLDSENIKNIGIYPFQEHLEELSAISKEISKFREKRSNGDEWSEILQDIGCNTDEEIDDDLNWGIIFSCFSVDERERISIEDSLIATDGALNLLSSLVKFYKNQNWVSDFASRNIDIFISNPNKLKELTFNLLKIGGRNNAYQLVRETLNDSKFCEEIISFENTKHSKVSISLFIEKLNEFHILSSIINDEDKMQIITSLTENLIKKLHDYKIVKLYEQNANLNKNEVFSLKTFISVDDQKSYVTTFNKPKILIDLFLAFDIMASNLTAAREICERFYCEIKQSGLNPVIFSSFVGYLLDPIDIAKLFINVGMEYEAITMLDKEVSDQTHTLNTIRFLAYYSNVLGNHRKAQKYYSYLFATGNITREEKIMYCKSLQYLGLWEDVYSVRKTINPLNLNDEIEMAIAAYKANNFKSLKESIQQIYSSYPNNDIAETLDLLFIQTDLHDSELDEKLSKLFKKPNIEIRTITLIEEYLLKHSDSTRIAKLIESLPGKYKKNPEIQLIIYKLHKMQGDFKASTSTLIDLSKSEAITRQSVLERIVQELLDQDMLDKLKDLLRIYSSKWKFSPIIKLANSKVSLGDKDYTNAKNHIIYLIENETISAEIITIFGCCLFETSLSNFPYRKQGRNISGEDKEIFKDLFNELPKTEQTLINKILKIEICESDKEIYYKKIYEDKLFRSKTDYWRIPFGLGLINYEKKQFDQAIKYFGEALKFHPTQTVLLDYLIQSFCQLKMPVEAVEIIEKQKKAEKLSLADLIKYSDFLSEYFEFERFLEKSELDDSSTQMYSIALAIIAIKKGSIKNAEFRLSKIESNVSSDKIELLSIAQCYIDCGNKKSSKRILENFLSKKRKIKANVIIWSGAIYYQLQEYEKAENLLETINGLKTLKSIINADIFQKRNQIESASELIESVLELGKQELFEKELLKTNYVRIPSGWLMDIPGLYLLAANLRLTTNNFEKAFELVTRGLQKFPNEESLEYFAVNLSFLVKNNEFIGKYIKDYLKNNFELDQQIVSLMAGSALENDQEILAAKIYSQQPSGREKDILNSLIQARLLIRNGVSNETNDIYLDIIENASLAPLPEKIKTSSDMTTLIQLLMVGETAFELNDLQTSFDISKNIYLKLGAIARSNNLFLKSLTSMLEQNELFEKIMIKNNLFKVTEDDLNTLSVILSQEETIIERNGDWKIRAEYLLNPDKKNIEIISELHPTKNNIRAIISVLFKLGCSNEAEKVINLFNENKDILFAYALLNLDKNPEISQSITHKLLQDGISEPEYLATLSIAYEKLEKNSDSYSAICLALEKWPNEYEWEIFAGTLSKKLGNNLASLSHFKRAESYNTKIVASPQENFLPNGSMKLLGESFLDSKFTNTAKDIPRLFKIINSLINENRLGDIDNFLNKLKKYNTNINEITLIEAKIAFKEDRLIESLNLVDTVLQNEQSNLDAIKFKTTIIAAKENLKSAIEFLDNIDRGHFENPSELIIQKADLIKHSVGIDSSIKYLTNEEKEYINNLEIATYLARLYLRNGNPQKAQDIALGALNIESNNSDLLCLLGAISQEIGDLDKAIDYMMRSITIDPLQAESYIQLSNLLESRRDHKDAVEILIQGLDILPDDYSLLRYTGLMLYKQGKYSDAHSILIKAVRVKPDDPDLLKIIRVLENSIQIKDKKNTNETIR
jgi:tetratricopeptide (TPR) repeat protein